MKEINLKELLDEMRKSRETYERGVAKGIEIAMKAFGHWTPEDEKNDPGADQSNRGGQKNITRSL